MLDCDSHLFEQRTTWRDHIDPAFRDDALAIEDDELGYAWLTWRRRRLYRAEPQRPGDPGAIGADRLRCEAGTPAPERYDDLIPAEFGDVGARVAKLDEWGIDGSVVFPNYGLIWEDMLAPDPAAQRANLRAANRWMAGAVHDSGGRLCGVGHLSLRDVDWAVGEIAALAAAGVRLAMIAPAPVDGKALSHPALERVWAACCDHGVAPVFHVAGFPGPFDPAWYEGDPEPGDRLLNSVFLWVAPALALSNLILRGTLERFPDLRVGVIELSAHWVPRFLVMLDGAYDFYVARHGRGLTELSLRPSDYFLRQVRVGALAYEEPARLIRHVGADTFMYGSDWPHAEGIVHPRADYEARLPVDLDARARSNLFSGNVRWLLGA